MSLSKVVRGDGTVVVCGIIKCLSLVQRRRGMVGGYPGAGGRRMVYCRLEHLGHHDILGGREHRLLQLLLKIL